MRSVLAVVLNSSKAVVAKVGTVSSLFEAYMFRARGRVDSQAWELKARHGRPDINLHAQMERKNNLMRLLVQDKDL